VHAIVKTFQLQRDGYVKIRTSFVANSSSSSFILFYGDIEEFNDLTENTGNIYCIGRYNDSDAVDFFFVDNEMFKFLKKNELFRHKYHFQFLHVYSHFRDSWEVFVKKQDLFGLPESFLIKGLEVNNWSTQGLRNMINTYSRDEREADEWLKLAGIQSTKQHRKESDKIYKKLEDNLREQNQEEK